MHLASKNQRHPIISLTLHTLATNKTTSLKTAYVKSPDARQDVDSTRENAIYYNTHTIDRLTNAISVSAINREDGRQLLPLEALTSNHFRGS